MKVHAPGRDLAEARDGRLVLGLHEGVGALHELTGAVRGEDNEGEAVLFALEAIFYGYTGHEGARP